MNKAILLSSVGAFALTILTSTAEAQDSEQSGGRIDTIVVTAQKRAEDIQEVPISISAYGSEFIEKSGVETLYDISLYSPNLSIATASSPTNQRIAIRGVGSVSNNAIEPSVGIFIDGVYYPRSGSVLGNLIDIETIEVLRGPQGTLFGRNTPMGAINITTKDVSRDQFESSLIAGFGSQDSYEIGGSVSGPLSERAAFRLTARYDDRDGFGDNLLTGENFGEQDNLTVRGKLAFDVKDNFEVTLTADYAELNSGGNTVELLDDSASPVFLGTLQALFGPEAANIATGDPFDQDIFQAHGDLIEDEQWGLALNSSYEFESGHSLRSITSYREWEAANVEQSLRLPADIIPRVTDYSTETFSHELQFLSPGGETIDYIAGLFFYDEQYEIAQDFDLGPQFCIPLVAGIAGIPAAQGCAAGQQIDASESDFDQDLRSKAIYGQATWNATDAMSFTLGGRYTSDDKTGNFTNVVNNPFVTALGLRDNDSQLDLDAEEYGDTDAFTYFANASFFPADAVMLFGTLSTGFKSGGFNSEGAFPNLTRQQRGFAPEDTTNYEIGFKSQLFDNTLQLNTTVFRMDIDDFQDRAFDGITLLVLNAGELRQQGVETDFVWAPLDKLQFIGGVSYLDSEFQEYDNASPLPGGMPQDLAGERNHFAPEWQGSLVADWSDSFALVSGTEYFIRAETQYMGEQNVGSSTNQDPDTVQNAYQLYNARVGIRSADGAWELSAFGRNLSDEGYCVNIFDQPFGGPLGAVNPATNTTAQRCTVGQPLTWGVQLRINR